MKTLMLAVVLILIFLAGFYFVTKIGEFLDRGGILFEDAPEEKSKYSHGEQAGKHIL